MSSPASSNDDPEREETEPPKAEISSTSVNQQQSSQTDEKTNNEKTSFDAKSEEREDSESDDKDEDEENEEVGLLDRPVEVSGSRERKKVQRLELSFNTSTKDKHEIPEGSGDKLGDCPRIEYQIQKTPVKELKALHKILFGRVGSSNKVRKNIRKFSGFTFKKGSAEYDKKKAVLDKIKSSELKHFCEVLDLERGGAKEDIVLRILDFVLEPKDSGRKVPQRKKRASGKGVKRKRGEKRTNASASDKPKKIYSSDEENEDTAEDSAEPGASGSDDDEMSDEEPKKKKPKTALKRSQTKPKEPAKRAEKKTTSRKSKKKKKASSDDSSSDDEPLVKMAKSPPTNEEIKALVKKILQSADLQEITMKKVIKQVFDEFPDFDLSDKKDYIKATVKSVIS